MNQIETCINVFIKKAQYIKYKELYQVDVNIIKNYRMAKQVCFFYPE